MGFDGEGVFQEPFLGGNLLVLLPEMLNVDLDSLPCHRYRLVDSLPKGDAAGQGRPDNRIPAFRFPPEEDTVVQVSHCIAPHRSRICKTYVWHMHEHNIPRRPSPAPPASGRKAKTAGSWQNVGGRK